jgi:hypothetical protein
MYLRTIKHHIRPGKLDEFDRLWQAFWSAPRAKAAFIGTAVYWGMEVMRRHGLMPAPPPVSA